MDNLRLSAVADRVVAWHNRHPLARRISAAQVHAIGYVALPFTGEAPPPAAPSAAQAATQAIEAAADTALPVLTEVAPATLKRNFSEHFIDTLTPRQVARFALKHGRVLARAPLDGPVREVVADGSPNAGGHARANEPCKRVPAQVYLLTAVIETDTRKSRVLLGDGPLVLGRRIHSSPRILALAALGAGLVGAPLWWLQPQSETPAAVPETLTANAPAVPPALAPAASTALPPAPAAAPAPPPSSEVAMVVPIIEPPAAPPPQAETSRRVVSIVPMLSDEQKALAREQRQALMEAAAAAAASAASVSAPAAAAAAAAAQPTPAAPAPPMPAAARPALAAAPSGPVFAISTRALRTRAEADQVRVAMQALLQTVGHAGVQVDVLAQGDDWRVVALPFPQRADAEKGRALLASRGMRVAVVDF